MLCLTFTLTLLTGCNLKPTTFTSAAGMIITANTQWEQVMTLEEMQDLIDGVTAETMDDIDLALQKDDSFYFAIEKFNCAEDFAAFVDYVNEYKDLLAQSMTEEELIAILQKAGYQDTEIAIFEKAWQTENMNRDDEELLYQESVNASWLIQLDEDFENYSFIAQEEILLFGKTSILLEYKYANDTDGLHIYEANVKIGDTFYTLTSWTTEDLFTQGKDELKSMITTAVMPDSKK